jgi:hypothetical protein
MTIPELVTKAQLDAALAGVGSRGTARLALARLVVGFNFDYATTSTTFAAVDAALTVTFTAPASGKVSVVLSGSVTAPTSSTYAWDILQSGVEVAGTAQEVLFNFGGNIAITARTVITGLTPGQSYTWAWGHARVFGSGAVKMSAGPTRPVPTMEVWEA